LHIRGARDLAGDGCVGAHTAGVMVFPARGMARMRIVFDTPLRHAGCAGLSGDYALPRGPYPFCPGKDA